MRVVHLAAVDAEGGAARAGFRLHQGLLAAGQESAMLVGRKVSKDNTVFKAATPDALSAFFWDLIEKSYLHARRSKTSNTYFSIGYPGIDVSRHPVVQAADVIQLHWVADFLSAASLARLTALGKPLVWMLHDQRPFTGGCHFSAGCAGYEKDCRGCPQLEHDDLEVPAANLADQLRLVPAGAITVVSPSQWLADCARRSALFKRSRIETIPYGIETEVFVPQPRAEARRKLGWPTGGFHVLFGADYGNEKRKGFRELAAALLLCWKDPRFQNRVLRGEVRLAAFGRPSPELTRLPVPIESSGFVSSEEKLACMYAAANLFVLPSLEDNLPNTVLESMSCGTPVLAFKTGGVPDLVVDGLTGRLAPTGDSAALSSRLLALCENPGKCESWATNCRTLMTDYFSMKAQTQRYASLYERLLVLTPRRESGRNQFTPASLETGADTEPGSRLESVYPELLLKALEHFAGTMNYATADQRKICREMVRLLQDQPANSAQGAGAIGKQPMAELKSAFMTAETLRQERLRERRRRRVARRERWAGLFRKVGIRTKATPA